MSDPNEWLSLGEAAEILGVHPSTLRSWADSGEMPSRRTRGGHRRFRRRDLQQWTMTRGGTEMAPAEAQLMMQSTLGRARIEIGEGQLAGLSWYDHLTEEARKAHRGLGRQLLELLTQYLANPEEEDTLLGKARHLGEEYAILSTDEGLSLTDSVRAFLFFRDLLTGSVIQMAETLSLTTPLEWGDRIQQVNRLTDELLLALIERYEAGQAE